MADTGLIRPQSHTGFNSNGANAIDDTVVADDATGGSVYMFSGATGTAIVSDFTGTDLPAGATVDGVEVTLKAGWAFSQCTTTTYVGKGGAGGSFGSTTVSQDLSAAAGAGTTIYTQGSNSQTWGVSWSGFTDLSDLAVKITSVRTAGGTSTSILAVFAIRAKIYYTEAAGFQSTVTLKGGSLTLKGGTLTIK